MKRPRNHVIEEESHRALSSLVPSHWVIRRLSPDYGLDYMVEIFKDSKSTGSFFFIQLKGTDRNDISNGSIKYRLKKIHLEYYQRILNPVLLVVFSSKSKQFWAIWTNKVLDTEGGNKAAPAQKSFEIQLGESNLIDHEFFAALETQYSNDIGSRVGVRMVSKGGTCALLSEKLTQLLINYYRNEVLIGSLHTPNFIEIVFEPLGQDRVEVGIKSNFHFSRVQVLVPPDSKFLYHPVIDIDDLPYELTEILMVVSFLLKSTNIKSSAELLIGLLPKYKGPSITIEDIFQCGSELIETKALNHFERLAMALLDCGEIHLFQFFNATILMLGKGNELAGLYQSNLVRGLMVVSDSNIKAHMSYNLANSYRSNNRSYEAMTYYQQARRLKPSYLGMAYWWYEVGGILFESGHFGLAEAFYKKSIDVSEDHSDPLVFALLGDSQFFQGKVGQALSNFLVYFERAKHVQSEFRLKAYVSECLVNAQLDHVNINKSQSDEACELALSSGDESMFKKAIELNPTSGLAWFNYGVLQKEKQPRNALFAFLTTTCIQRWDLEAWRNALLLAFNLREWDLLVLIYDACLSINGEEFVNYLFDQILELQNLSLESKKELIEVFVKLREAIAENSATRM